MGGPPKYKDSGVGCRVKRCRIQGVGFRIQGLGRLKIHKDLQKVGPWGLVKNRTTRD